MAALSGIWLIIDAGFDGPRALWQQAAETGIVLELEG
jgi:hypothetical protein